MIAPDLAIVLPELVLAGYALAALMYGVFSGRDGVARSLLWMTALVMAALALWIATVPEGRNAAFFGSFVDDGLARFAKVVILLAAAAVLLTSEGYLARQRILRFEYPILVALAVLGMMVMVSADDLMVLYMGLELQSLSLYVIASFQRDSARSTEAGLKYFMLGALASGLLLYGASLVYGFAGSTRFEDIAAVVAAGEMSLGLLVGLVFLITGLAFKVSAVPFHMWTPDVYQGAPTAVTAFLATAPKVAALVLTGRVLHGAFGGVTADWQQIIALLAVLSMFLGAIAAIGQRDIKRMMAFSSIGHMGFALIGLAAGTIAGLEAMLLYAVIYVTMNVGTFAFIMYMERDGRPVAEIGSLAMLSRSHPGHALALLVLMFSLAGIPPLVGFFGKFAVLLAAVDAGMAWLAVLGVVASVIGAFYYLRICYLMYFGEQGEALDVPLPLAASVALGLSAVLMVAGVVNLFGVDGMAAAAAQTVALR